MAKHLTVFFKSLQTSASDSATVTTMTNRPEGPDSWDFIDNLDIEAEQQSFLLIAAVALSFLESYE